MKGSESGAHTSQRPELEYRAPARRNSAARRRANRTLVAVCSFDGAVVDVVAKLDTGVERTSRLAPTLRNVKSEFGSGHVSDKQRIGIEPIGREHAGA